MTPTRTFEPGLTLSNFIRLNISSGIRAIQCKSTLRGLIQSLLYQMLKQIPDIILDVYGNRSGFEAWELGELKEALRLLLRRADLSTRFCFFIDGLDEYSGEPQDVVDVIQSLAKSTHVKICASSRPWHVFEDASTDPKKTLAVQDFTKDDMASSVHDEIAENVSFKKLKSRDPNCESIIKEISLRAKGVWLWVHLVSRDIKRALNSKEEYSTLKTILDAVPPDLFAYFEAIIKKIKHVHRKQRAQIFLVTVDAVSPLPLYAFAFLEKQSRDVQIRPVTISQANDICQGWKSKIQNRCGDLLITRKHDDSRAPLQLHVDFLHRTVCDWLRDNFFDSLQKEVGDTSFDPRTMLCEISLCLLKTLAISNFRESINDIITLVDEILYYSYEIERTSASTNQRLIEILDEMDRVNRLHSKSQKNHWTHARDLPRGSLLGKYTEDGNCSFLALAVQFRLVRYVRNTLDNNPQAISKDGRPLLDYALRPRRVNPAELQRHTERESASVDIKMIQLLLDKGANPNDKVFICDNHTVWGLFLLSCFQSSRDTESVTRTMKTAWQKAVDLLIDYGADYDCFDVQASPEFEYLGPLIVPKILTGVFWGRTGRGYAETTEREPR